MFSWWKKKSKYQQLSLNELLLTYRQTHDRECINELSNRYLHLIFTNCLAILKDEVKSKEASMLILERMSNSLLNQEVYFFETWLSRICKNHCLNILRSEKNNALMKEEFSFFQKTQFDVFKEEEKFLESLENNPKLEQLLEDSIQLLKPIQKKCLQLFYFQQMTYQEIAQQENLDIKSVKSHLQNGKRNLKNLLIEKMKNQTL